MKQRRQLPGFRIYRSDVGAFVSVADSTTQSEILLNRLTAMLYCNRVINLVFR